MDGMEWNLHAIRYRDSIVRISAWRLGGWTDNGDYFPSCQVTD